MPSMNRSRAVLLLLILYSPILSDDVSELAVRKEAEDALIAIEAPFNPSIGHNLHGSEPDYDSLVLWSSARWSCPKALDVLLWADPWIEPILLADARRDTGLDPRRIRAAYVLAVRDNVDVIPALIRMLDDQDVHAQFMARSIFSFAAGGPNCRAAMEAVLQQPAQPQGAVDAVRQALEVGLHPPRAREEVDPPGEGQPSAVAGDMDVTPEQESLMRAAEDRSTPVMAREAAMESLSRSDCSALLDRILCMLRSELDELDVFQREHLRTLCVLALSNSSGRKATEALAKFARDEFPSREYGVHFYYRLLDALNGRLGTRFHTIEYACRHIERHSSSSSK